TCRGRTPSSCPARKCAWPSKSSSGRSSRISCSGVTKRWTACHSRNHSHGAAAGIGLGRHSPRRVKCTQTPATGPSMRASMSAAARAHSNIALIKYWGKRDARLNLPAVGSISVTLNDLYTDIRVTFAPALTADRLLLDDHPADTRRLSHVLDLIRTRAGCDYRAAVESHNNFPTGAGLASSASGFAALVVAACAAFDLQLDNRELSTLARQGSGSAARSVFGGYAEMQRGT